MDNKINKPKSGQRLASIDAYRGATIAGMIMVINPGSWKYIYPAFRHANWNGCTLADLVFPFFLFIVGVSITYAFSNSLNKGITKKLLYSKIIKRSIILFIIGLFLNSFPNFDLANIRIMGVLQRIALCYLIVSFLFLNSNYYVQIIVSISLLFIYWALMEWVPLPELGLSAYEKGTNVAAYFDRLILSGHMGYYEKIGEPEGFISMLPAISTTLFGVLTGHFLKSKKEPLIISSALFITGVLGVFGGMIWAQWLPINKNLWTSSYSVLTAGFALIVFSLFYFFIDVLDYRKWAKPFIVFGMNAITVYVLSIIFARLIVMIKFTTESGVSYHVRSWFYDNILAVVLGNYNASLIYAFLYSLFWCGIMWIFYNK
ncbi:MAG: DUF5009 domain-containing protein, partial [Bacteroidetes bacterium]|nr:DUF5009 domain-containing protein [Bacteroidota bacterium]MBU1798772.1 DUF5009 domain-containing protein [Bacteroidota bacterium]